MEEKPITPVKSLCRSAEAKAHFEVLGIHDTGNPVLSRLDKLSVEVILVPLGVEHFSLAGIYGD